MSLLKDDSPDKSPDSLSSKPQGGRRLNRVPLIIMGMVLALFFIIFMYTYEAKLQKNTITAQHTDERVPEAADSKELFGDNIPQTGAIKPLQTKKNIANQSAIMRGPSQPIQPQNASINTMDTQQYQQTMAQIQRDKLQALQAALVAPTTVDTPQAVQPVTNNTTPIVIATPKNAPSAAPNAQTQKQHWLNQKPSTSDYSDGIRTAPLSPYEIQAGTIIPGTMITGISSELPGTITAQVSQNVYDSATGQYLLIPQGSRLIGIYDNGITAGQQRVLVAWNRVIYPDGSYLDLGMMPGVDQGGYAGFKDKVNNHYLKIFGNAFGVSLFSAGIQLSQPQAQNGDNYSSSQIIAASIGQQMGQLGMQLAEQGISIPPTDEIRPGYQFNIMINKDFILTPWQGES